MHTRILATAFVLLVLASLFVGCTNEGGPLSPVLIQWCGSSPCDWQTDSGKIEAVGTWNEHDKAISFEEAGTQISRLSENKPIACMWVSVHADVVPQAELTVSMDFNDDGRVEYQYTIPGDRRFRSFGFAPPVDYRNVRYMVQKRGEGRAVLMQLSVGEVVGFGAEKPCTSQPILLEDGAACMVDESCTSALCAGGRCSSCGQPGEAWDRGTMTCADGLGCHKSEQCTSGVCAGGICQSCAIDGTCPALTNCDSNSQCLSGACVQRLTLSTVTEATSCLSCVADNECGRGGTCTNGVCETCVLDPLPKQCAECTEDAQCPSGVCAFGLCASCQTSEQCPPGQTCRFTDRFDLGPRVCSAELVTGLPRGALCEANEECADGLACGAVDAEAKRCGVACENDPSVCGDAAACTRASLAEKDGLVFFPQRLKPAFADVGSRVATCYTLITDAEKESKPCTLHAECSSGACCEGTCGDEYQVGDPQTGACGFRNGSF